MIEPSTHSPPRPCPNHRRYSVQFVAGSVSVTPFFARTPGNGEELAFTHFGKTYTVTCNDAPTEADRPVKGYDKIVAQLSVVAMSVLALPLMFVVIDSFAPGTPRGVKWPDISDEIARWKGHIFGCGPTWHYLLGSQKEDDRELELAKEVDAVKEILEHNFAVREELQALNEQVSTVRKRLDDLTTLKENYEDSLTEDEKAATEAATETSGGGGAGTAAAAVVVTVDGSAVVETSGEQQGGSIDVIEVAAVEWDGVSDDIPEGALDPHRFIKVRAVQKAKVRGRRKLTPN